MPPMTGQRVTSPSVGFAPRAYLRVWLEALANQSAGSAFFGRPADNKIGRDQRCACGRIVSATPAGSAALDNGFGYDPETVAETSSCSAAGLSVAR